MTHMTQKVLAFGLTLPRLCRVDGVGEDESVSRRPPLHLPARLVDLVAVPVAGGAPSLASLQEAVAAVVFQHLCASLLHSEQLTASLRGFSVN